MTAGPGRCPVSVEGSAASDELGGVVADQTPRRASGDHAETGERRQVAHVIRMSEDLHAAVKAAAGREERSMANLMRRALRRYVETRVMTGARAKALSFFAQNGNDNSRPFWNYGAPVR